MPRSETWCKDAIARALAYVEKPGNRKNSCVEALAAKCLYGREESHGFEHALRVRDLAVNISDREHLATDTVETAALLHDVLDHKYLESAEANRPEIEAFLKEHGGLNTILPIIESISYSKEKKMRESNLPLPFAELREPFLSYRHVISDADKIEALGPIGLKRCVQYTLESSQNHDPHTIINDVALHLREKLLILLSENYIRTPSGRELAQDGTDFLQTWYDEALMHI